MKNNFTWMAVVFVVGILLVVTGMWFYSYSHKQDTVLFKSAGGTSTEQLLPRNDSFFTINNSIHVWPGVPTTSYYSIVIRSNNGDIAMRDSLGNWEIRGDVKAILEQWYQSELTEKKVVENKIHNYRLRDNDWGNTISFNDPVFGDTGGTINLWQVNDSGRMQRRPFVGDYGKIGEFYFNDSTKGSSSKYPVIKDMWYKREDLLTNPPRTMYFYHGSNGKDSVVERVDTLSSVIFN